MKKGTLTTALLLLAMLFSTTAIAQEQDIMTYLSCDFTDGIPAEFTTHDLDQQTLHYTMVQGGIKQGEAWARKKESGTGNYYAVSACRYKEIEGVELKPSDDWLITPRIWIRGNEATLSWDGKSIKNQLKVGASYQVLISTTGNNPADFTQPAIFATDEESLTEWVSHTIDLSDYAGQRIYIAFHNNSAQGEFIGIDNLTVTGHRGICDFQATTGTHIFGTNNLGVSAAITSFSNEPITDITLYYRYNNQLYSDTLSQLNIATHETFNYTFDTTIPVAYGDTVQYTVGAIVNGVLQDEIECSTVAFVFKPAQHVVIEEATAMWCTFCPTGIVAMQLLQEKYPEQFIGLALHYDDPIAVNDYVKDLGFDGFPSAWINRKHYTSIMMAEIEIDGVSQYVTDHGGMETYFLKELEYYTPVEVLLGNIVYEGDQVNFDATVRSAIDTDVAHYQLAFVVVENNVWQNGYYQKNGYSGKGTLLNGWEEKPSVVYDFAFNHVARAIYDSYQGFENSVPEQLLAGEEHTSSYTLDLPSSILTPGNVKIVAMIINMDNGSIVNATESDLIAGINTTNTAQSPICYTADSGIHITLPSAAEAHITLYSTAGTQVASHTSHNTSVQLPAPAPGVYVVTITQHNNTSTHKIVVR
ncbi:MAG: choice-of-anchor J domain-containing protein [Bacteroidaceae bacterium]|nr:choice-of-anchor J domain-containing protein [Bacteroidaceae bacterium]